jgi:nicotinamide-nucleotide amidase
MNAEIIAVGSELLLGQIANTNAQYLSRELADIGINVYFHSVVGDNRDRLRSVIEDAQKRSNLIIFTGGLGPTKDDLTKETIAVALGKSLVYDQESLRRIETYFTSTNRVMTENNKKQASVIEGSTVLLNDAGMAPGMGVKHDQKVYLLFPGPPHELKVMFETYGKPYILDLLESKETITSRVLRFFGIGESQLETELLDIIERQTNPTIAPLAGDGEVTLRLTAKHSSSIENERLINEAESTILERVGDYFYGYGDDTIYGTVVQKLKDMKLTIACAESLTGGLFSEAITRISGASTVFKGGVVTYTNSSKRELLNVEADVLDEHGAISEVCAKQMARNIQQKLAADIGISFTGVAGPSDSEGHRPGTVFIGLAIGEKTYSYKLTLTGGRRNIRHRSMKYGCFHLLKCLKDC